jgi:stress-induced morphogen
MSSSGDSDLFPVKAAMTEKLIKAFDPSHLDVLNESHMHNVYVPRVFGMSV